MYHGAAIGRTIPYYPPVENTTDDNGGGYIGPGNGIDDDANATSFGHDGIIDDKPNNQDRPFRRSWIGNGANAAIPQDIFRTNSFSCGVINYGCKYDNQVLFHGSPATGSLLT